MALGGTSRCGGVAGPASRGRAVALGLAHTPLPHTLYPLPATQVLFMCPGLCKVSYDCR